MRTLDSGNAKKIMEDLRSGVPSPGSVSVFSVGRKTELDQLKQYMNSVQNRNPEVLFIRGDWGAGKTHLLMLFEEEALKHGFVVSHVTLTTRETPLNRLDDIYRHIIRHMRMPEEQDGKKPLETLLDSCVEALNEQMRPMLNRTCKHGLTYATCARSCLVDEMLNQMFPQLDEHDWCVTTSLKLYVLASVRKDDWLRGEVLRWLLGETFSKGELKKLLWKAADLPMLEKSVGDRDIIVFLTHLSDWAVIAGYSGIIVFFDEAESIPSLTPCKEYKAYINLTRIVKSVRRSGHMMFVYSTTPTFYEDLRYRYLNPLRYFKEDRETAEVIDQVVKSNTIELQPIPKDDLLLLAERIATLYSKAENRNLNTLSIKDLRDKASTVIDRILARPTWTTREFVTAWCSVLDENDM